MSSTGNSVKKAKVNQKLALQVPTVCHVNMFCLYKCSIKNDLFQMVLIPSSSVI